MSSTSRTQTEVRLNDSATMATCQAAQPLRKSPLNSDGLDMPALTPPHRLPGLTGATEEHTDIPQQPKRYSSEDKRVSPSLAANAPVDRDATSQQAEAGGAAQHERADRSDRPVPLVAYVLVSGFLAAGLSGLVAFAIPSPWGLRVWFGLTAAIGATAGLARDRFTLGGR